MEKSNERQTDGGCSEDTCRCRNKDIITISSTDYDALATSASARDKGKDRKGDADMADSPLCEDMPAYEAEKAPVATQTNNPEALAKTFVIHGISFQRRKVDILRKPFSTHCLP